MRLFKFTLPTLTLAALALAGCASVASGDQAGSAQNARAGNVAQTNQTANAQPTQKPAEAVARITVADAKAAVDAGKAVIVDSRGLSSYEAEHIAGSISIPVGETEARHSELPANKQIITYCS